MLRIIMSLCAVAILATGCASTNAEVTKSNVGNSRLPYPSRILVYDFATSPSEVPSDSVAADRLGDATEDPQENPQRQQLEHQIAAVVADRVVADLQELGLPAMRWRGPAPVGKDVYTIEGQFLTIDEGSALKRMIIGFGAGGTEVKALVQAYRINPGRRDLLGEAEVSAESSKKPGLAATLPIGAATSGIATAAAVSTGVGVVTELNTDVRRGAEDTAEAIVELLRPRMEEQGWVH
jgi:Domain of unknown function (DUF4410)